MSRPLYLRLHATLRLALCALLITGCASRDAAPGTPDTEHLRAAPPSGWVAGTATLTNRLRMNEYLRPAEPALGQGWVEKMTFERLSSQPVAEPGAFMAAMREELAEGCPNGTLHPTYSGSENGYATEVALMSCPRSPAIRLGQITMIKVIQGNEALYTITRALRVAAFDQTRGAPSIDPAEIARWAADLAAMSVCDPTRPMQHPCDEPAVSRP